MLEEPEEEEVKTVEQATVLTALNGPDVSRKFYIKDSYYCKVK
jgi:hypothetical protein